MTCPTCQSQGFEVSKLGPTRCTFCDGTEGGNPPTVLTVREWFRVMRGQLWARDPGGACDLDKVATAVTMGEWPQAGEWVRIGTFAWIESVESYAARERLIAQIRRDMDTAVQRLYLTGFTE